MNWDFSLCDNAGRAQERAVSVAGTSAGICIPSEWQQLEQVHLTDSPLQTRPLALATGF